MFDKNEAQWKIFVMHKSDKLETICVLRSHHSLFDGGSAFMIILPAIADELPNDVGQQMFGNVKDDSGQSIMSMQKLQAQGLATIPNMFWNQMFTQDKNAIVNGTGDQADGKWVTWSDKIALTQVYQIRKALKVRFSSVITTCLIRAINRYLAPTKDSSEFISVYQAVSMWTPADKPALENRITGACSHFPMKIANSSDHVKAVDKYQQTHMERHRLVGSYLFIKLTSNLVPHVIAENTMMNVLLSGITFYITSAMGPKIDCTVDNNEINGLGGVMPLPPTTSKRITTENSEILKNIILTF
jgi:hypothetical protein